MKNYIFDAFNDNVIDLKPIFFNESRKDSLFAINIFGDLRFNSLSDSHLRFCCEVNNQRNLWCK